MQSSLLDAPLKFHSLAKIRARLWAFGDPVAAGILLEDQPVRVLHMRQP